MVGKLSAKIAEHLCDTAVITEEDKDLYSYDVYELIQKNAHQNAWHVSLVQVRMEIDYMCFILKRNP